MYPKYKCQELIDEYADVFIQKLGIVNKVKFTVVRSDSKIAKTLNLNYPGNKGLSFINNDGLADVIIYYDMQDNAKDALGTIIHELLHVAINKLAGLVTINCEKAHRQEELFVQRLEYIIIDLLWDHKL